jgi:hypothetical protein
MFRIVLNVLGASVINWLTPKVPFPLAIALLFAYVLGLAIQAARSETFQGVWRRDVAVTLIYVLAFFVGGSIFVGLA